MGPARRVAGLALVGALLASGCGFQERRAQADFVVDTAERVRQAGAAQLLMVQTLQPIQLTDTDIQIHPFPIPMAGALDIAARRTSPGVADEETVLQVEGPLMVFDDEILYVRRLGADPGERTWAKLDLAEVGDLDDPLIGFNIINPVLWVELLGGALTGSVERMGEDEGPDGEQLVRYRANFDREKAFRDEFDDDEFQRLIERFELMGITDIVIPGQVWLDEDGLPRRIVYRAAQRVDRNNAFALVLAFQLSGYGGEAAIELPDPDETVEVEGILQLINELGAEQLMESFRAQIPADG